MCDLLKIVYNSMGQQCLSAGLVRCVTFSCAV